MASPLGLDEAEELVRARLGETSRAAHSRFVGLLMERMAVLLGAEPKLWQIVGLVHDLDYFAVDGEWGRHGVLAAEWLAGRLPAEALTAIVAHDHRTGVHSVTLLAEMLRLCDAVAVLDFDAGRLRTVPALRAGRDGLAELAGDRAYLVEMIAGVAARRGLELGAVADRLAALPRQMDAAP